MISWSLQEMIKQEDIIGKRKQTDNMHIQYKSCGHICTETVHINTQTHKHTLSHTHTHILTHPHTEAFFGDLASYLFSTLE